MVIRALTPADDRGAVSRVYEESWRFAYRAIVPQEYLDAIPSGRWADRIDMPGRNNLILLDGGTIVGTASYGASRFPERAGWGEIYSLYLLPAFKGKGGGRALFSTAVRELDRLGFQRIFLWVLEENTSARGFYEHMGFTGSGRLREESIGGRMLREREYVSEPEKS